MSGVEEFLISFSTATYLINIFNGSQGLKQTASWPNHTSHRKVDFNEFVQNYLGCDMGIIIFDLHGFEGC